MKIINRKEYIYALLAIVMWGTMSTVAKLLLGQLDSMYVLAYTCLFATLILLGYSCVVGNIKRLRELSPGIILRMTAIGSLGVFFYNLFYFMGTTRLPAQEAFVINDLWPALIIIFSWVILKEKMSWGKIAAVVLSFIGIIVVTTNGDINAFKTVSVTGIIFCVLDAICYALYSTLGKRENYDKGLAVLVAYLSGTIVAFICVLVMGNFHLPTVKEAAGLMYNGIICNAIPYLFWAFALDMGNTAIIANMVYLTPFISLLVTHFVLGERITVFSVLGLCLIVAGIVVQFLIEDKL